MYDMNISANFGSSWSTRTIATLSSRMMTHCVIATAVANRSGWRVGREPSFTVWSRTSFYLTATGERNVYELTAQA